MTLQNHLIYVAFGGRDYQNEILWSIFSLYQTEIKPDCNVHVFTDDLAYLQSHVPQEILLHELTPNQISIWKGADNYPYRVKIKVLQECLRLYSGQFLYVDSDVVFRQPLQPLFKAIADGAVFMDTNEGPLYANSGGIATKMKKLLRQQQQFTLPNGEIIGLNEQFEVWNSGCIGITNIHLPQLQCAEVLMDVLYARYPLFSMEQIAVTKAFADQQLQEAKSMIHHYWYYKEFRLVIRDFLAYYSSWDHRLQHAPKWNPWILSKEKRAYKKMGFWERTLKKISRGYRWKNPHFMP